MADTLATVDTKHITNMIESPEMRGVEEGTAGIFTAPVLSLAPFALFFLQKSAISHTDTSARTAEIDWTTQSASSLDNCEWPPMQIFLQPVISSNCLS